MPSRYCQSFYQEIEQRQLLVGRQFRQRAQDSLRAAGGAGGIEHRGADALIGDRRARQVSRYFLQADDAVAFAFAIGDDAEFDLGAFLQRLARDIEFFL